MSIFRLINLAKCVCIAGENCASRLTASDVLVTIELGLGKSRCDGKQWILSDIWGSLAGGRTPSCTIIDISFSVSGSLLQMLNTHDNNFVLRVLISPGRSFNALIASCAVTDGSSGSFRRGSISGRRCQLLRQLAKIRLHYEQITRGFPSRSVIRCPNNKAIYDEDQGAAFWSNTTHQPPGFVQ